MPNSDRNQSSSTGKIVTFGLGALAGALAAGAAWYMSGQEEEPHRYSANHPVNRSAQQVPPSPPETDDGTIRVCEICFEKFSELKQNGVQIVTTPCGHIYCRDCILGAIRVKPECPHCRNVVRERDLTRLFM